MTIKLIGAGFPRTGTNTLKKALEILGFEKTYHFKEVLNNPDHLHYWESIQMSATLDWESLYHGYQASVDFPAYAWYKEHMVKYPEAKVILTKRPFEQWYESVLNTLYLSQSQSTATLAQKPEEKFDSRLLKIKACRNFVRNFLWKIQFEDRFTDKRYVKSIWEQHHIDVIFYVPKEKLLVYEVADGWKPLCDFLEKEVPNTPFPHLNKKGDFVKMMQNLMKGDKI